MKDRISSPADQDKAGSHGESPQHELRTADGGGGADRRVDTRRALAVQAFVTIPSLRSRAYGICEISRSGMFLAFTDERSTRLEMEQHNIDPGTNVEVAFAVSVRNAKYRFSVRARIVRISSHGIGVQFATRNPPQLAALRELFPADEEGVEFANRHEGISQGRERRRTLSVPSDAASWKDWELVD